MGPVTSRFDHRLIGLAAGLIGPIFGCLIFQMILFNQYTFIEFIKVVQHNSGMQSPLIAISLVFNLVFFFAALRKNWYRAAQGVIMAMFVYAPVIIYLKYA